MDRDQLSSKASAWRKAGVLGVIVACLAVAFSGYSFLKSHKYASEAASASRSGDTVEVEKRVKPAGRAAREAGTFLVQHIRGGKVIYEEVAHNFLTNEGENDILDCFYRGGACPTSFTFALLTTSAAPAEGSSWANVSGNECGSNNCYGYQNANLVVNHDGTANGWPTLDTVNNGTGGCTETTCGRVTSRQVIVTATQDWGIGARYVAVRTATTNRLISVAQLASDRTLLNTDQFTITYRQVLQ